MNPYFTLAMARHGVPIAREPAAMAQAAQSPARADAAPSRLQGPRRHAAVAAVLAAMVLAVLDAAIANVALPFMARSLQVTPGMSVWIITAYQTALVMGLLPCAALSESLGYRRVFTLGVALFTTASALCALSPSLPWLVAARFLQGLGGAAIMVLGIALLRLVVPQRQLGAAIGWNALAVALSSAAGPTLGAVLLSGTSWSWLFALKLPLGGLVLLASRALPDHAGTARPLDRLSVALNAGAFASLVVGAEVLVERPGMAAALLAAAAISADSAGSARDATAGTVDSARPTPRWLLPHFGGGLGLLLRWHDDGVTGAALLPAAQSRAGHLDDRALHDTLAADRGHRSPGGGPSRQPDIDSMALRCRGRVPCGRACRHISLATSRQRMAAGAAYPVVRTGFRPLSGTEQPQYAFVGTERESRARQAACRPPPGWRARRRAGS